MVTAPAAQRGWIDLSSGLAVSADRLTYGRNVLTLHGASRMGIKAFNRDARPFDVRIEEADYPIRRLVKVATYYARREQDGRRLPSYREYVDFSTLAAARKAVEPFASFYRTLIGSSYSNATRNVVKFRGKTDNRRRYRATLLEFDDQARLQPVADITLPREGWIHTLDKRHKLPTETRKDYVLVSDLGVPLDESDAWGFWYIGDEPRKGEQRLALRDPDWRWHSGGLLRGGVDLGLSSPSEWVAALLMRPAASPAGKQQQ